MYVVRARARDHLESAFERALEMTAASREDSLSFGRGEWAAANHRNDAPGALCFQTRSMISNTEQDTEARARSHTHNTERANFAAERRWVRVPVVAVGDMIESARAYITYCACTYANAISREIARTIDDFSHAATTNVDSYIARLNHRGLCLCVRTRSRSRDYLNLYTRDLIARSSRNRSCSINVKLLILRVNLVSQLYSRVLLLLLYIFISRCPGKTIPRRIC